MIRLIDQVQIIDWLGSGPLDLDTDRTFDYVNVQDYRRALVIFQNAAGTAGDDWNFTVRQASSASGTGVKDADIVSEYWLKQAATDLTAVSQFTRSTQTADALIAGNGTAAEQVCQLVLDLDLSLLDHANGFNFLGGTLTLDASSGAQYGAVTLVLYSPRYPQATALGALS